MGNDHCMVGRKLKWIGFDQLGCTETTESKQETIRIMILPTDEAICEFLFIPCR